MRWLQDYPHVLEIAYRIVNRGLQPFKRWLVPKSSIEPFMINLEIVTKGTIFDCRMCGQCILHSSGMTCPMTCPKTMRNGPCGGVRSNAHCEVFPDRPCIWVQAWERSSKMPIYGHDIRNVQAPVNNQLRGTSAWINDLHLNEKMAPPGWQE